MEENVKFVLTFVTSSGAKDEYEIPRANGNLQAGEIEMLMDDMTANAYITTTSGRPVIAASAEVVKTAYTELI